MIRAVDLSKRYDDGVLALDALNFEVAAGEVYCLLGARGSGKTSAVRLMLGLTEPTAGRVELAGLDVRRETVEARRQTAFLPADFAFYDGLTARENLRLFSRLGDGRSTSSIRAESQAMREVGLPEVAFDQRLSMLRIGDRQKLAIAVALLKDVPIWILDDPLSGLDPQASAEVVELIRRARDRGRAILWATQDLFRAKELADRVGILKEGRQVLAASREELGYQDLERLYLSYMRGGPAAG
ncbi:MAG: ABC transporter ATP-binding protein [Acidobacteriota bacterium]